MPQFDVSLSFPGSHDSALFALLDNVLHLMESKDFQESWPLGNYNCAKGVSSDLVSTESRPAALYFPDPIFRKPTDNY